MIFTREPLIETIISPKDGYKLCVRSSKGSSSEEYLVDSVEVVSFGKALFFRSLERPKSFLVPITDYEVLEIKDTRVALKSVSHERNIKIGGGRESALKVVKEPHFEKLEEKEDAFEPSSEEVEVEIAQDQPSELRNDKKRDRRRHRRRRLAEERKEWVEKENGSLQAQDYSVDDEEKITKEQGGDLKDETTKVSSSTFSSLIPPPQTLISETISRYREKEGLEGVFFQKSITADEDIAPNKKVLDHVDASEKQDSSEATPISQEE